MADRVFLHIGLPKTGTTYLQRVVWGNKEVLARSGLLVPGRHHRRHLLASLDVRDDPKLARRSGDVTAPWQDLVDEVNGWRGSALITHEFFGPATEKQARRAIRSFGATEVHLVLTARAMVDLGLSRWQEWVRNGGVEDIDSFPRSDRYDPADAWGWASSDLADVLTRWGAVVPNDRVHVLPMRPGAAPPSELWYRFASVLGVDPESVVPPAREDNTSLGLVETEVLRRINVHLTGFRSAWDRGHWIRDVLAGPTVLGRITSGERFRPGEEKLASLQSRGQRGIEMLTRRGFDVVGNISLLEPTDVLRWRHPSEVGDDELLATSLRANALLLESVRAVTQERNNLQADLGGRPFRGRLAQLRGRRRRTTKGDPQ